jgi:hypothetical protein
METKLCTYCFRQLELNNFSQHKSRGKTYYRGRCRDCLNKQKNAYLSRPEVKARNKATRKAATPEQRKLQQRRARWKKYGADPDEMEKRLAAHDGKCELCGESVNNNPCVDHCHSEIKVRGILCTTCNTGLGFFKDSQRLLLLAIDYLNRNQ